MLCCGVLRRYNRLLKVIINSLRDLLKALKGLVVMSQQLEEMANSIFINQVPSLWAGKVRLSYPLFTVSWRGGQSLPSTTALFQVRFSA